MNILQLRMIITRELMETFHTELLSVPKRVHLESRSRLEPYQTRVNSQNGFRQERLEMRQGKIRFEAI